MLEEADRELIQKRKHALRHLALAAKLFPLLWLLTVALTWLRYPLMNNPWVLHKRILAGHVGTAQLESLAFMTPIMTILSQFLVIAFIWMGLRLLKRERRLVELVEQAYGPVDSEPREG